MEKQVRQSVLGALSTPARYSRSDELVVLNLQLAGVGSEPGLRNLCEALRKRLDDAATFLTM